jgi:hypothetical protein
MNKTAGLLLVVLLAGCASSGTQSPAQRRMQADALRANSERLKLVTAGALKADVEQALGVAGNRQIFREGSAEVQIWTYPFDEGYARLKFREGKLVEQSTQRTSLTFARDTTIPLTQKDLDVHAALALVKLGWTKAQVERLPVKPAIRMTEKETAEVIAKMRKVLAESGADLAETNRDLRGEMWMYLGHRLNGSLLFRQGKVVEISFSEQPTKAQQDEIMQRR